MVRLKVLLTRLTLGVLHAFINEWLARSHYHLLTLGTASLDTTARLWNSDSALCKLRAPWPGGPFSWWCDYTPHAAFAKKVLPDKLVFTNYSAIITYMHI